MATIGRPPVDPLVRFGAQLGDQLEGGCIPYLGHTDKDGYGLFWHGRTVRAHRWAYEQEVGAIPPGMVVDHTCHDPATCDGGIDCPHRRCMNTLHMTLTTPGGNVAHTRRNVRRGDRHPARTMAWDHSTRDAVTGRYMKKDDA